MFQRLLGNNKGASIVELALALFVISIGITALLTLAALSLTTSSSSEQRIQANAFAGEMLEAVRNFRDGTDWDTDGIGTLTTGVNYYTHQTGGIPNEWELVLGTTTSEIFTKRVVFEDVQRDIADDIVPSGGTNDPDSRKVTAFVSWTEEGDAKEISLSLYITNWR